MYNDERTQMQYQMEAQILVNQIAHEVSQIYHPTVLQDRLRLEIEKSDLNHVMSVYGPMADTHYLQVCLEGKLILKKSLRLSGNIDDDISGVSNSVLEALEPLLKEEVEKSKTLFWEDRLKDRLISYRKTYLLT